MEIQTQTCVYAIIYHFLDKDTEKSSPLLDKTQWKRLSKSGTGNEIKRVFENKITGSVVEVTSSETQILNIVEVQQKSEFKHITKFDSFDGDLSKDFPFKEVFKNVIIWRKEQHTYTSDCYEKIDKDEQEEFSCSLFPITKGTRIGILEYVSGFTEDGAEIIEIIEYIKDGFFYAQENNFTDDGVITFVVEGNKGYFPVQEPCDVMDTEIGVNHIGNASEIKELIKKYKLNHLLEGA